MKKTDYKLYIKALLIGILPLISCVILCFSQGGSITKVFLPNSEWNDEVFYFKQVESIVKFGFPKGYFGFNESHALKLSFAAWSPALYLPWSVWGLIFGWRLMSPIAANIVFMSVALIIFVLLVKPDFKQTILLAITFLCFRSSARYMLSVVPEIVCHSFAIIITALGLSYREKESRVKLAFMFVLAGYAGLMRPYMILFLFLPMFFLCKKEKIKGALISLIIFLAELGLYLFISKYLQAAYFEPIVSTTWIKAFFTMGFAGGAKNLFWTIVFYTKQFFKEIGNYFLAGRPQGGYFLVFVGIGLVLFWQSIESIVKTVRFRKAKQNEEYEEEKKALPILIHMTICFVCMFFALILMYNLQPGARHLLVFISAAMIALCGTCKKSYIKSACVVVIFFVGFAARSVDPYEMAVPFATDEAVEKQAYWTEAFDKWIKINETDTPNYYNTLMWVYSDLGEEGVAVSDWTALYYLPKGIGISCTTNAYAKDNIDSMASRYIMVPESGEIAKLCEERGFTKIGEYSGGRYDNTIVYLRDK